jgi:hypothetical protein
MTQVHTFDQESIDIESRCVCTHLVEIFCLEYRIGLFFIKGPPPSTSLLWIITHVASTYTVL